MNCWTPLIIQLSIYNSWNIFQLALIFVKYYYQSNLIALWCNFGSSSLTRTLLVGLSLACLEITFVVKGAGAVILLFRLEYKTSVICHNVNAQNVKTTRRDRPNILASNWCETFENLLHIDIALLRRTLSGIWHSKIERWFLSVSGAHDSVSINIHSFFVVD